MAHRAATIALALAGLALLPSHPLSSLVLFGAATILVMDRRHAFGGGRFRAILAFVSALWLALAGVVTTLLGLAPPTDFLLWPGLMLLGSGLGLFVWSIVTLAQARRSGVRIGEWDP